MHPTTPAQDDPAALAVAPAFSVQVRHATRAAHQRLENTPVMRALMAPDLTLARYLSTLLLWQDCWQCLEAELAAGLQRGMPAALLPASRLDVLAHDIAFVSAGVLPSDATVSTPKTHPDTTQLARLARTAHGWYGLAYVVQGSLLGGALLRKQLMASLALSDHRGTGFFAGGIEPSALHRQWQLWLALADRCLPTPTATQEAVLAADGVFAYMENAFSH